MRPYRPKPDSFTARFVDYLRDRKGEEATTREVAAALGINPRNMNGIAETLLKHEWVRCRKPGKDILLWSLGPAVPRSYGPDDELDEWPMKRRFVPASAAPMQHKPGPASVFDLAEAVA